MGINLKNKKQLANINKLPNGRNDAVKFIVDYLFLILEAKHQVTKGTGLKVLIPKQMFQILSIALSQVKAGSNLDNLLKEIRQIVYSLHQSKEITKNVYNNLIKSIQILNGYYIYELRK